MSRFLMEGNDEEEAPVKKKEAGRSMFVHSWGDGLTRRARSKKKELVSEESKRMLAELIDFMTRRGI